MYKRQGLHRLRGFPSGVAFPGLLLRALADHAVDIEHGPDAPRLRDSAARCVGRVGIVKLANRPDTVALDVFVEIGEYLPGLRQECIPVDIETCLDVELQQPRPCRTVLAREIALCGRTSFLRTFVEQVAGRECPQPLGDEQVLAYGCLLYTSDAADEL